MGQLVRIRNGLWVKNDEGGWVFDGDQSDIDHYIVSRNNQQLDSFMNLVREELLILPTTPMVLTYRLPDNMLDPHNENSPPHNILTSEDVEVFLSIQEWRSEVIVCVTSGALSVAKYQFMCRTPFKIGDTTYLNDGMTEEQHLSIINDEIGDGEREFKCSERVLRKIFSEESLLLVYRYSFEMEKAKRSIDLNFNPNLPIGAKDVTTSEMENSVEELVENFDQKLQQSEGCNVTKSDVPLPHSKTTHTAGQQESHYSTSNMFCGGSGDDEMSENPTFFKPTWANIEVGSDYWETVGMQEGEDIINLSSDYNFEDNGSPSRDDGFGFLDIDNSSTGSTAVAQPHRLSPTLRNETNGIKQTADECRRKGNFEKGDPSHNRTGLENTVDPSERACRDDDASRKRDQYVNLDSPIPTNQSGTEGRYHVLINDSSSEAHELNGVTKHNPHVVYVGMVFQSREEFKQHMSIYAIHNKFRFRNSRSAPGCMVLRCFSITCNWRVYAVNLKNTALYEVRKIDLHHSCSVDDRSGYQSQATHSVIGGMMKARFAGRGGGPRPNEIIQAMQGDHDVHISYWKAWRSREVALDYAKGSCGASYNLLPAYLEKLVATNAGTIAEIHTEYSEDIGHKFKYMFLALAACMEGFKSMRKVIVVDGTHLRGKYAGCLLTASAQDGNYQVFPLAVAVVDGENDKAWEWFFLKLTNFIPNNEDIVFVSDRHPSIYYGIAKVYSRCTHCACILHLKRNIRTSFKDKHLGYLVGKAARAYRKSDFYSTFTEIKRVNPSCAEYLTGIGFAHWTRSHCNGNRFNIMTSNVAETWNAVLREAREYPILSLVEFIRAKLMKWFTDRRQLENSNHNPLTPRVQEIVTANFENSGMFGVHVIRDGEYEVKDKHGDAYHVNLSAKTCTCYEFQALQIPCTHAVAAATRYQVRVDSLVSHWYTMETYKTAYAEIIAPAVEHESIEILSSDESGTKIAVYPPSSRRPPGRPRKNRILSRGEFQIRGARKRTMCSRCKCYGHNRATCKSPI